MVWYWTGDHFAIYETMYANSPWKDRRERLARKEIGKRFRVPPHIHKQDKNEVQELLDHATTHLPHVPGAQLTPVFRKFTSIETVDGREMEATSEQFERIKVPWRTHAVMWFEDLDYTSPIWLNVIALSLWASKFFIRDMVFRLFVDPL